MRTSGGTLWIFPRVKARIVSVRSPSACFVGVGALKRQQVEVCPTGWEDYFCDFLQRQQRENDPLHAVRS